MTTIIPTVLDKLREAGVPELQYSRFAATDHEFNNSGRTTLTEGLLATDGSGDTRVVVKTLNKAYAARRGKSMHTQDFKDRLLSYFMRESDIWIRAHSHPNIARIIGFMPSFGMKEGRNMGINLKLHLLRDVIYGLQHLHKLQPPIVHRDLTASNVLLKNSSTGIIACINDFGSAKLMDPALSIVYSSSASYSYGWEPPEYVKSKTYLESYSNPKPSGDIWSFACVFLEVITGNDPWPPHVDIFHELEKGNHPPRPDNADISKEHWKFLEGCWRTRPGARYTTENVAEYMDQFVSSDN